MDVNIIIAVINWFLILMSICVVLLCWIFYVKCNYWRDRGIPFVKPYLFVGNLSFLITKSFWDFCYKLKNKYPMDYVGIFLAWKPALMVQSPELARKILVKDFDYFQDRYLYAPPSDPLGSLNLFILKNPMWSTMKRELAPMFTPSRLKIITEFMNLNAKELVSKIRRECIDQCKDANLKELFSMYSSDTLAYNIFGIRVSVLKDQDSPLWYITKHMVKWTFWRGFEFSMIFFVPAVAGLLRLQFFSPAATTFIKKMFWDIVGKRDKNNKSNSKDLVEHLLKIKENLKLPVESEPELADNLMLAQAAAFMFGSIETSSTTLSYCLHELANHPHEQEILYEEVREALQKSGKDYLNYEELLELKYLSACINETMRKYPPLAYLDRICNKKYVLNNDVTIEKGTPVFINVVAIHHNENLYPEPEKWLPERMNCSTDNDNLDFTFLPFGEGPRYCIGKRYGMMQLRAVLVQLISAYEFGPADIPYKVDSDPYAVILSPKDGLSVKFIPR